MVRRLNGRQLWLAMCAAAIALAIALPAVAQSTGMVRGTVHDPSGKPIEGATVKIDADGSSRHFETKSDKKGEFVQIGLSPGPYKVVAEKDKVPSNVVAVTVRIAAPSGANLIIGAGAAGGVSPEAAAKNAELKKTFEEGVAASRANNHDEAIAKFTAAAGKVLETATRRMEAGSRPARLAARAMRARTSANRERIVEASDTIS